MGSGASRQDAVDTFELSDDEEKEESWNDKKDNKNEEKKEMTILGRVFGKPKATSASKKNEPRNIVDLDSSDSEDDTYYNDEGLREDIDNLEKTLNSLGLEKRIRKDKKNLLTEPSNF